MEHRSRAIIAFIAGSLVTGKKFSSIHDCAENKKVSLAGSISDSIYLFDREEGSCKVSGNKKGQRFALYNHGNQGRINLVFLDNEFSGYDYHTSSHFQGAVEGESVSIYDYGESRFFDYRI